MKIIINGKFLTQRITGVQRYAREILLRLDKLVAGKDIVLAVPSGTQVPDYENLNVVFVGKRSGILWEQWDFARYVKKQKAISLNLCNASPLFAKKIVCVHDVKIKAHPEFFSRKFLLWYNMLFNSAIKKAERLITVSEFSKSEIVKYYGVPADKITVIGNGYQHFNGIGFDENALNKYALEKGKYYFAMSSLEPNKNVKWIVEAAKKNKDVHFAVAGGVNNTVFAGEGEQVAENVSFLGYVSDEEAKTLMRDSLAFLYPTIYEGFGIPPIEAVSAGCKKLVVSDTPIMHEILGDNANYIDPESYGTVLDSDALKPCSAEWIEKYSWQVSAEKMLKLIEEVERL